MTRGSGLAAAAFVDSVSPTQLIRTMFAVDDAEWRRWSNVGNGLYVRQGVSLKETYVVQREAAMAFRTVDGGQVAGAESPLGAEVWVYRGLPFAAPPVGDLRWRPPQPVVPWDGIRDATVAAPACVQTPIPAGSARSMTPMSAFSTRRVRSGR